MKDRTKTIIGFDSWTIGAHHFARLAPEFKRRGYHLLLIHIGSWGHDKQRPIEEMIGELLVRDISYYEGDSFNKILKKEKPSAIIFLSTRALAHMAFNRYANQINIPTCHLYHGLVKVQADDIGQIAYKTNYLQHLQLLSLRAWKNIYRLIPCYVKSLIYTSAPKQVWSGFFWYLFTKVIGSQKREFLLDKKTTIGCVYTKADIEHMEHHYGILKPDIYVVGNPDLSIFGLHTEDIGTIYNRKKTENPEIMYIDTALSKSGLVFSSDNDFIQHLVITKNKLESQGYRLIVKLHPAYKKSEMLTTLGNLGIELCTNETFIHRLKFVIATIVEPSTVAIIPALIGLPILLAQYGKLSNQLYGEVLTTYPRARILKHIEKLNETLEEERRVDSSNYVKQWVDENIGPLPAEDMPKRVVDAISQMISTHNKL